MFLQFKSTSPQVTPVDMLKHLLNQLPEATYIPVIMPYQETVVGFTALKQEFADSPGIKGVLAVQSKFLLGIDKSIDKEKLAVTLREHLLSSFAQYNHILTAEELT